MWVNVNPGDVRNGRENGTVLKIALAVKSFGHHRISSIADTTVVH